MRVLVTGATGFVGGRLVAALAEAGHEVVALTRDAAGYEGPGEAIEGDLLDPGTFEPALEDVEAAYYLIHSMESGADFAERDRRAAHNFARAASAADLSRVIYLGGLGEDTDDLSAHLQSRREVGTILAEGTYDLTTLRAAIVVGADSSSFELIRQLAKRLPVMITPRWVRTECQPIAIEDVVAYLVGVLDAPETAGETYEIGGPEALTYQEMIQRTAAVLDRRLIVLPIPVLTPKLSAYWVDLVTDVPRSVAHPLILGMKNRVVVEDTTIDDVLPIEHIPFDVAVARALGVESPDAGESADSADADEPTADGSETADDATADADDPADAASTGDSADTDAGRVE